MDTRDYFGNRRRLRGTKVTGFRTGKPEIVYHGTAYAFSDFDPKKFDDPDALLFGPGFYFTDNPAIASEYAEGSTAHGLLKEDMNQSIQVRRLAIKNPFDIDAGVDPSIRERISGIFATRAAKESGERWTRSWVRVESAKDVVSKLEVATGNEDIYKALYGSIGKKKTNRFLGHLGFDAITHLGGGRRGPVRHQVWIPFKHEQLIAPFDPPRPRITGRHIIGSLGGRVVGKITHRFPVPTPATVAEISTPELLKEGVQTAHVNLESNIGKFFKNLWKLPFKKHSQVDPLAAAMQAFRTFQAAPAAFLSSQSQFSGQETSALTAYKGFGFSSINQTLRTNPALLSSEGKQVVNTLDILTHAGVVEKDFTVHRGFHHPTLEGGGSLVGREFTEQGFSSTSLNPYVPDEFARTAKDFTTEIRLKKGSKGFLLASHEAWKQGDKESEFILPRGTRYKVLEEHAAESVFRPRHLVLEATTPERSPVPVMTEAAPAAVAAKLAVGETIAETHVNLEGKTGGWLKKIMNLPFLKHSRVDLFAAAVQAQGMNTTKRPFNAMNFAGILLGGVLSLGASFTLAGWQTVNKHVHDNRVADSTPTPVDPNTYNAPIGGPTESFMTKRMEQASPGGSTNIHITDADLDGDSLDKSFASHLKSGFAHS